LFVEQRSHTTFGRFTPTHTPFSRSFAKRNDNFRQEIVVSFCTFHYSFFIIHSSLKIVVSREKIKEKREKNAVAGGFILHFAAKAKYFIIRRTISYCVAIFNKLCYDQFDK